MSVQEAIVASFMDRFHWERSKATLLIGLYALIGGIIVCLGYNVAYFELPLPNGAVAQILDLMDYISNIVFMPLVTGSLKKSSRGNIHLGVKACTGSWSNMLRRYCCLYYSYRLLACLTDTGLTGKFSEERLSESRPVCGRLPYADLYRSYE